MSIQELKKAEEQYDLIKSKLEKLLETGDLEAIQKALHKIKDLG